MLVISNATISPRIVEVSKEFVISITVTEIDSSWEDLCNELSSWQSIVDVYDTWYQLMKR